MESNLFNDLTMSSLFSTVLNFFLALILPVQLYLLLISGVLLLDSYYGVMVSRKKKHDFKLTKLLKGISIKMAIYTPAMLGVYWLDFIVLNDFILQFISVDSAVTKVGCAVLISTELSSINDNMKELTGESLLARFKNFMGFAKKTKESYENF